MKRLIATITVWLVILVASLVGRSAILGKPAAISLAKDPLASPIANSLQNPTNSTYLPIEGKDFVVKTSEYFDNNQWAVVSIEPVGTSSDSATIVFHDVNGTYKNVLGPGSFFSPSSFSSFPKDVINYIKK